MNFKSLFFACLMFMASICATTGATVINAVAAPQESINQNDYTYVYHEVDGVTWVFVYDKEGNLVTAYPEL